MVNRPNAPLPPASEFVSRRLMTFLANMRRRYAETPDERDTHCLRGHELTPENTLWVRNQSGRRAGTVTRSCRECTNNNSRKEVS